MKNYRGIQGTGQKREYEVQNNKFNWDSQGINQTMSQPIVSNSLAYRRGNSLLKTAA